MEKFSAHAYVAIGRLLERVSTVHAGESDQDISDDEARGLQSFVSSIDEEITKIGLRFSKTHVRRILNELSSNASKRRISNLLRELDSRIVDEMQENLFLFVPPERADFYDKPDLIGKEVSAKFPNLQSQIIEAGNCYALGRGTAAVFHLMRVLEAGLQEFGNKLGVALANQKVWQVILDETNKKIKALPPKDKNTVEMSQAASNLYAVKLAWRNEVMHPKETYTLEEAENLIRVVGMFMRQIATIV